MYKIKAILKSPLMIGGKTLNSNYRESMAYIPGSVLRAAYAKALVQRCTYKQENYWLEYKAQNECKKCEFRTVCKNFSEILFPALYPMGSSPYPITAMEKKYKNKDEKSVLDILKIRLVTNGKAAEESEWKKLEGFHRDGIAVKLLHSVITRTAIDYRRNAAKQASLYTQNVISEKYLNDKKELSYVVFSGETQLSLEEEKELNKIKILHIGADITRGFGICYMSCNEKTEDDTSEKIKKRIQKFNLGIEEKKQFVVLDLLTDAYLGLEDIRNDYISQTEVLDREMLEFLEMKIGLSKEKYSLCNVFKYQEILRGFDTSKASEKNMRRNGHLVVKAGAVFVYKVMPEDIDGEELLRLEKHGIGKYVKHGFGKIRVCDKFHIKYDVLKGESRNG